MPRPSLRHLKLPLIATALLGTSAGLMACGSEGIQIAKSNPYYHGAQIFADHCSGCHTFDVAGTQGGATNISSRERVDGPNFNVRKEQVGNVLFALRNGGYSGAIMPQNIVVGAQAMAVAKFVAKYSGFARNEPVSPNGEQIKSSPSGKFSPSTGGPLSSSPSGG